LLFVKTKPPVEPVGFVKRICEDTKSGKGPTHLRSRYVNRLTPSTLVGKATEQGIVELARKVLSPWFDLSGKKAETGTKAAEGAGADAELAKSSEGCKSAPKQSREEKPERKLEGNPNDYEGFGDKPARSSANDVPGDEVTQSYSVSILSKLRVRHDNSLLG
jgi:tRNA acetyltransferase TAN1